MLNKIYLKLISPFFNGATSIFKMTYVAHIHVGQHCSRSLWGNTENYWEQGIAVGKSIAIGPWPSNKSDSNRNRWWVLFAFFCWRINRASQVCYLPFRSKLVVIVFSLADSKGFSKQQWEDLGKWMIHWWPHVLFKALSQSTFLKI